MERVWIEEGVLGPAWVIVPISESEFDRMMFNDVVVIIYGRNCKTTEEVVNAQELCCRMQGQIRQTDMVDPTDRQKMWKFHKSLLQRMMDQSVLDPDGRDAHAGDEVDGPRS